MKRTNAQAVGSLLQNFYKDNPALWQKVLETRVERAWGELMGPMVQQATRNLFIKNGVLYVSVTSSVLRNELMLNRTNLVKSLNEHAGESVIRDVVIR